MAEPVAISAIVLTVIGGVFGLLKIMHISINSSCLRGNVEIDIGATSPTGSARVSPRTIQVPDTPSPVMIVREICTPQQSPRE